MEASQKMSFHEDINRLIKRERFLKGNDVDKMVSNEVTINFDMYSVLIEDIIVKNLNNTIITIRSRNVLGLRNYDTTHLRGVNKVL